MTDNSIQAFQPSDGALSAELHATRPNGMRKCWRIAESEARRWLSACTE